jgi:glucosamine--fructose-6-phosphate aminotransferase (isomerizing)
MCGIFATLGLSNPIPAMISALNIIQNRGYDSCGVCLIESGRLNVKKFSSTESTNTESNSSIRLLTHFLSEKTQFTEKTKKSATILHTRWATTGKPCVENAHPHNDSGNRISLVHNGIIENYQELRNELIDAGYTLLSMTDTEVISVMIGYYLDLNHSVKNSIKMTVERLTGTWALVVIHRDFPDKLWITRNGSPLLLGMNDNYIMIASEHTAFDRYIKRYVVIDNHDLLEISNENSIITYNLDIHRYAINHREQFSMPLNPVGYNHWMMKEISEQSDSVSRAMNIHGRIKNDSMVMLGGLDGQYNRLSEIEHIIILGCGTSLNAGLWAADLFKSLIIFNTVSVIDGAEFSLRDIPLSGKVGIIMVSQSGETADLFRCIQIAKLAGIVTIGVVNVVDSLIARETDCGVYLNAGREVAVASTKSFTNQCVVLSLIAIWFSQNRNTCLERRRKIITDMNNLCFQLYSMVSCIDETINLVAASIFYSGNNNLFILGKGSMSAIAMEGSLKLKEVAYIHAEGYSTSALKHGPLALITRDTPVIILDIGEEYRDKTENCVNEVYAREGKIIRITDLDTKNASLSSCDKFCIYVDKNSTFGGVIANCTLQILSYYIALKKGHDPDFPRNLAKCVSVS